MDDTNASNLIEPGVLRAAFERLEAFAEKLDVREYAILTTMIDSLLDPLDRIAMEGADRVLDENERVLLEQLLSEKDTT